MTILPVDNTILNSVTYIIYCKNVDYCILIDCGEWDTLHYALKEIGKKVKAVLLTHGHLDHIYGLNSLLKVEPSLVVGTNEDGFKELSNPRRNLSFYHENPFIVEGYEPLFLHGGMTLHFDGLANVEVMSTPGHSPSCLTYKIDNHLFTGDAYIPGVKVYTSLPYGNKELAFKSIDLLSKMKSIGYNIHCGHHSYEK